MKYFHKRLPVSFAFMLKTSKLPRGAMIARVERREMRYGVIVDAFLREFDEGKIGAKLLLHFLFNAKGAVGKEYLKKLTQCSDSIEAQKVLSEMETADKENALDTLFVRYVEAYINLEGGWIGDGRTYDSDEIGRAGVSDEIADEDGEQEGEGESPESNADEEESGMSEVEEDEDRAAEESVAELEQVTPCDSGGISVTAMLDQALDHVAEFTVQARICTLWSDEQWQEVVTGAREAVHKVRAEVERLATAAGRPFPEWKTREQLDRLLEELKELGDGKVEREKLIEFLKSLEAEVRALNPVHKLASKRESLAQVREAAADEIGTARGRENICWPGDESGDARAWLEWVIQLHETGLENLIASLNEAEYPRTASLVEDLEHGYELGGPASEAMGSDNAALQNDHHAATHELFEASETVADRPDSRGSRPEFMGRSRSGKRSSPSPSKKEYPIPVPSAPTKQDDVEETALVEVKAVSGSSMKPAPRIIDTPETQPESLDQVEAPRGEKIAPTPSPSPQTEEPILDDDESDESEEVFEPLGDLVAAASSAITSAETEVEPAIEKVIWNLLDKGERPLAFQILNNAHETGLADAFPLPPSALEILALLPAYSSNSSEVPHRIRTILQSEDFSGVFKEGEPRANRLRRLILAAALLRPSLFDPSSNAGSVLEGIRLGRYPSVLKIVLALAEFGRKGVDLNATILSATLNAKGWKDGEHEIVTAVFRFLEEAPARKIKYMPATRIWIHWFQNRDGWMKRLLTLASNKDRKSMESLASALETVEVEEEISRAWNESNIHHQFEGTAREALRRLANEALGLICRRLDHWKSGPHSESNYRQKVLEVLFDTVTCNLASAKRELVQMVDDDQPFDERNRIAVNLMLGELDQLNEALEGTSSQVECPSSLSDLDFD